MTHCHPRTLLSTFKLVAPAFTKPGFGNALVMFVGWVLTRGRHAVTEALVVTGMAARRHHEAFHRFFSRGTWSPDRLGHLLLVRIVELCFDSGAVIDLVLDDTLVRKKGPAIFGIGNHLDAVRSTKAFRVLSFGHVWVVLSVVVRVPFSKRPWALPIMFRLYRTKTDCRKRGGQFCKKTELGKQMVEIAAQWLPSARFRISADDAYANSTVLGALPSNVVFVGSMRADAVLTAPPTEAERKKTGRRRVRGERVPKPEELAKARKLPWTKIEVFIYGRQRTLEIKTVDAQWYRGAGERLLRIVVVRINRGSVPLRVFFSTDPTMSVTHIIETYAGRWSTESCFRDLKQLLGFDQSQARTRAAVERVAPFVGHTRTILVLWFLDGVADTPLAAPPIRPWYGHKSGLCFADILRAAQRLLANTDVLDLLHDLDDLHQPSRTSRSSPPTGERAAA